MPNWGEEQGGQEDDQKPHGNQGSSRCRSNGIYTPVTVITSTGFLAGIFCNWTDGDLGAGNTSFERVVIRIS